MTSSSEYNELNVTTRLPDVVNRALLPNMASTNYSVQNVTNPSYLTTQAMNGSIVNFTTVATQSNFTSHDEYNNETTFGNISSEASNISSSSVSTVKPTMTPTTSTTTSTTTSLSSEPG